MSGRSLKSSSDFSIGGGSTSARAALSSSSESTESGANNTKKSSEVLKLNLPGGAGVRIIGYVSVLFLKKYYKFNFHHQWIKDYTHLLILLLLFRNDAILTWKPLVHVSPSNTHLLVNDRTGLLWLFDTKSQANYNVNVSSNFNNPSPHPPRPLGRAVLGYLFAIYFLFINFYIIFISVVYCYFFFN